MDAPFFGYSLFLPTWTLTFKVYFYLIFLVSMVISHRFRALIFSAILLIQFIVLQMFFNEELKLSGADSILLTDSSLPFGFLKRMSSPMLLEFIYVMLLFELRPLLKRVPNQGPSPYSIYEPVGGRDADRFVYVPPGEKHIIVRCHGLFEDRLNLFEDGAAADVAYLAVLFRTS